MSTGITNINIQGPTTGDANKSGQNATGLSDIKVSGLIGENTPERRSFVEEQNKLESRNVKQQLDKLVQKQSQLEKDVPSTSTPIKESIRSAHDRVAAWNNQCPSNDNQREGYFEDISCKGDDEYFNRSKEKLNNLLHNFRSYEEEKEDTSNVPKRVQLNLITVISQFMDGIWCGDLPDHYKRLFKKDLTYMEYGYTSLIEMCIALDHIFHYVRPGKDDFKLYDRSKPLPDSVVKTYTMASYSVGEKVSMTEALPNLSWDDFKFHIPDDILKLGEDIPREFLPVGTKVDTIFDVTEIYDPSKFWFYLGRCVNAPRVDTPPRLTNQDGGDGAPNREWQRSWSQSSMGGRGVINPPRLDTPPRLFTPPSLHPIQWSHGPGFPVPHYTQWSNGGHQPMPGTNCPPPMPGANYPPMHGPNYPPMPGPNYPPMPGPNYPPIPGANYPPMPGANYPPMAGANYPPVAGANYPSMPGAIIIRPRDSLRPPPGITHQGVPPNFNPYFTPRMVSTGPGYEQVGPIYYPPPNQMLVPPLATTENDFYDRYNKSILQRSNEPS